MCCRSLKLPPLECVQIAEVDSVKSRIAVSLEKMQKTQAKIDEITAELENAQV
jgi:hypothetical protein